MNDKIIIICTLTDDPFAPAGRGSFGGSHIAISNIGRYLVRAGYEVIFFTRRISKDHPKRADLGSKCKLYRIDGGPFTSMSYYMVSDYLDEMITNMKKILIKNNIPDSISYISYNWLSGEVVRRLRFKFKGEHFHLVLALSISRLNGGEGKQKISDKWIKYEKATFNDAKYIFCGSKAEKEDLLDLKYKINKKKVLVLNYGIDTKIFHRRPRSKNNYICRAIEKFQERINNNF